MILYLSAFYLEGHCDYRDMGAEFGFVKKVGGAGQRARDDSAWWGVGYFARAQMELFRAVNHVEGSRRAGTSFKGIVKIESQKEREKAHCDFP